MKVIKRDIYLNKLISVICLGVFSLGICACSFQPNDSSNSSSGENNSTNIDKDDKNMKKFYVDAIYDKNKNAFSLDTEGFNIDDDAELYSKQTRKKLSNCIVGDYLEVHYKDDKTTVDKIIVDEANLITITKLSIPGAQMNEIDLITENNIGVRIRHENVFYVMNDDGTFSNKEDLKDGTMIYGVYRKEDSVKVNENHTIHFLVGLYSYLPRINWAVILNFNSVFIKKEGLKII